MFQCDRFGILNFTTKQKHSSAQCRNTVARAGAAPAEPSKEGLSLAAVPARRTQIRLLSEFLIQEKVGLAFGR